MASLAILGSPSAEARDLAHGEHYLESCHQSRACSSLTFDHTRGNLDLLSQGYAESMSPIWGSLPADQSYPSHASATTATSLSGSWERLRPLKDGDSGVSSRLAAWNPHPWARFWAKIGSVHLSEESLWALSHPFSCGEGSFRNGLPQLLEYFRFCIWHPQPPF